MNAELIEGMSDKDYFAIDALNASTIKAMSNPMLYRYKEDNPTVKECLSVGTDFHELFLRGIQPADGADVAISEYPDFRKKDAKAWRDKQLEAGKRIIKKHEIESYTADLYAMQESVLELEGVAEYLDGSQHEVVVLWERTTTAGVVIKCKAKLDAIKLESTLLQDVKTCCNIADFDKQVVNFGYYIQAAWYLEAAKEIDGVDREFQFVVAGSEKPYQSVLRRCPSKLLDLGRSEIEEYAESWRQCKSADMWPSPFSNECEEIKVPGWFYGQKGVQI